MNPNDCETYNLLGHMLWKKNDIKGSRNCFEEGLKKQKNKKGLRYLSIILRSSKPQDTKEKLENIKKSLELTK